MKFFPQFLNRVVGELQWKMQADKFKWEIKGMFERSSIFRVKLSNVSGAEGSKFFRSFLRLLLKLFVKNVTKGAIGKQSIANHFLLICI